MIDGPEYLRLESRLFAKALDIAAAIVGPVIQDLGLASSAVDDEAATPNWPTVLSVEASRIALTFGGEDTGSLHPAYALDDAWQFNLDFDCTERSEDQVRALLIRFIDIAAILADSGALLHVGVYRHSGGLVPPVPPIADVATHLVSATTAQIGATYGDPAQFAAAWDRAEQHGEQTLYIRALDAIGNPAFLEHVIPGQIALARAARPGTVLWNEPSFARGEFEILDAGVPTLSGVGYNATDHSYEFAGHLPVGSELRAIDLMLVARIANEKSVQDARGNRFPVAVVRAVFDNRDSAEVALPLLASAGAQSCFVDEAGETIVL